VTKKKLSKLTLRRETLTVARHEGSDRWRRRALNTVLLSARSDSLPDHPPRMAADWR